MEIFFCDGKEKCCSSDALRKKRNRIIWLANKEENLKDDEEKTVSVFWMRTEILILW